MTPRFTEHALFRYCQRVLGADIEWLKQSFSGRLGQVPGDGNYKLQGYDAYAIVRDGAVVSVMTGEQVRLMTKTKKKFRFKEAKEDYDGLESA